MTAKFDSPSPLLWCRGYFISGPADMVGNWATAGMCAAVLFDQSFPSLLGTVAVWTQKNFFPLLTRPQGSQGCQKITFFFSTNKTVVLLR